MLEYGWIDTAWSSDIDKFVSTTFVFMVMWTHAKSPIYPWYKKRQNKKTNVVGPSDLARITGIIQMKRFCSQNNP